MQILFYFILSKRLICLYSQSSIYTFIIQAIKYGQLGPWWMKPMVRDLKLMFFISPSSCSRPMPRPRPELKADLKFFTIQDLLELGQWGKMGTHYFCCALFSFFFLISTSEETIEG